MAHTKDSEEALAPAAESFIFAGVVFRAPQQHNLARHGGGSGSPTHKTITEMLTALRFHLVHVLTLALTTDHSGLVLKGGTV